MARAVVVLPVPGMSLKSMCGQFAVSSVLVRTRNVLVSNIFDSPGSAGILILHAYIQQNINQLIGNKKQREIVVISLPKVEISSAMAASPLTL